MTSRLHVPAALAVAGGLAVAVVVAIAVGSETVAPGEIWESFVAYDASSRAHLVIQSSRVPRTVVALVVGLALGACGALMQGLTRNPLADPGLLGVNAGASLLIAVAIHWLGVGVVGGYIWFALGGAALASVAVYAIGSSGRGGATPVKLTLAGAAFALVLGSLTSIVLLFDEDSRVSFLFWSIGSVSLASLDPLVPLLPFFAVGLLIAGLAGGTLNVIALGEQLAAGVGLRLGVARVVVAVGIVLLCGAATALAGPLSFVGLLVPFLARAITGPDYRWIIPFSAGLGALLLVLADLLGRLLTAPSEVPIGILLAILGAPAFILLARRSRMAL